MEEGFLGTIEVQGLVLPDKLDFCTVKEKSRSPVKLCHFIIVGFFAVSRISDNGVARERGVFSNLVLSAGEDLTFEKGKIFIFFEHCEVGLTGFAVGGLALWISTAFGFIRKGPKPFSRFGTKGTSDDGLVDLPASSSEGPSEAPEPGSFARSQTKPLVSESRRLTRCTSEPISEFKRETRSWPGSL